MVTGLSTGRVVGPVEVSTTCRRCLSTGTKRDTRASQPVAQTQAAAAASPQPITAGPPYIFDTTATYADPNVQAWMQYYAAGGKDRAGSVYFVSVPGVTDGGAGTPPVVAQAQGQVQGQQQPIEESTTRSQPMQAVQVQ